MLKRKNEESEESKESTHYVKRVALDAEAVEQKDIEEDKQKTSVSLTDTADEMQDINIDDQDINNSSSPSTVPIHQDSNLLPPPPPPPTHSNEHNNDDNNNNNNADDGNNNVENDDDNNNNNNNNNNNTNNAGDSAQQHGGPISSHRVQNDDPTYVHFRMLASISDTASIVGKGGESISKIKEQSNARVNVSENLKGIPERIISVRGSAEYVAKAFGLIIRTINSEPFDEPSNIDSKTYNLKLLFPHTVMGYIIGKKGSRFREIEENSAAALRANDQILPASTDRVLNINGVADAIHIATYYVAQTVIEHKQQIQKAIYYNPANYNQPVLPALSGRSHANNNMNNNNNNNNNNSTSNNNNRQFPQSNFNQQNMMNMGNPNQMLSNMYNPNSMKMMNQSTGIFNGMGMGNGMHNNMGMMGSPSANPIVSTNTKAGETVTGPDGKINQELFVPQKHIGLVIGRGGKNLKDIRQNTGCYVKVNDEIPGAADRKLTLIGNIYGIQNAIMLINNKIENEKQRQQREGNQ
ncbi:hypothetical protein C6P40_005190 [Pichia californica]|uniref:K Homology domain-containing protein n=1 Tax=Pichia californica TaxID=460514 RepID=A0A9P7BGK8_9ASCO|nr:hypothetical protein C6P42_005449 [[Candida] californica]KAG0689330.1 hypothetical protein C6P40_005190 [[Candida] californica]